MKNYTMDYPVGGVCDLGCPHYVEGSLEKEDLKPGEHCKFDGSDDEAGCGADERSPEATFSETSPKSSSKH